MSSPPDRLEALRNSTVLNGIDFVAVSSSEVVLTVHFLNDVELQNEPTSARITGGDVVPHVEIQSLAWGHQDGHPILTIHTKAAGDFSTYTLEISNAKLDRFYKAAGFSFKVHCDTTLDCRQERPVCPSDDGALVPVDYLAKDFASFKNALLDFSAQRYPRWVERSEADLGVMLIEAMSAVADDLSYTQDRVAGQAYLETATERRSLVRHARLVDYEPRPATASRVWLQLEVFGGPIPSGLAVYARGPDGERIDFETGVRLVDPATRLLDTTTFEVDARWNLLTPYLWDKSQSCLASGSTEAWVLGQGLGLEAGVRLLLDTDPPAPGEPRVLQIVELTEVGNEQDDLLRDPVTSAPTLVTHIRWRREDALRAHHDLTKTVLKGNIVPATQGSRRTEAFTTVVETIPAPGLRRAVVRAGPNGTDQFQFTLSAAPVAWLGPRADPSGRPVPELLLVQHTGTLVKPWPWMPNLLSSDETEVVTLDAARYSQVGSETPGAKRYLDYDGDDGDTLRFGDGVFGKLPPDGARFEVVYRTGGGSRGNCAAGAIDGIDQASPLSALVRSVTNPFPAAGGADAESAEAIRRAAPDAFSAVLLRAVRREDYERTAETLPWVQRAGTSFRWTGSWRTIFTAADALETGGEVTAGVPSPTERGQLAELLDRRKLAGYESYVLAPRFASLDLKITVCARPDAFQGHVKDALIKAMSARPLADGRRGFFHPDDFTFGQPLERSVLEAAIMAVPGVDGVLSIDYRRRGRQAGYTKLIDTVVIGADEILRVDGDPSRPERGSVQITVEGGK